MLFVISQSKCQSDSIVIIFTGLMKIKRCHLIPFSFFICYGIIKKEISFFKLLIKIVLCLFLYLIKIEFSPTGQFVFSTIIKYNSFLLYLCIEIPTLFNKLIKLLKIIVDKLDRSVAVKIFSGKEDIFYVIQNGFWIT